MTHSFLTTGFKTEKVRLKPDTTRGFETSSMHAAIDPDVMIRQVGQESVILDLKTERYLGLNETGTQMWSAIVGSTSIQSAYESLLAEYDVDPERLREDLQDLLRRLVEHGLVTLSPAGEAAGGEPE